MDGCADQGENLVLDVHYRQNSPGAKSYGLYAFVDNEGSIDDATVTLRNGVINIGEEGDDGTKGANGQAIRAVTTGSGKAVVRVEGGTVNLYGSNSSGIYAHANSGAAEVHFSGGGKVLYHNCTAEEDNESGKCRDAYRIDARSNTGPVLVNVSSELIHGYTQGAAINTWTSIQSTNDDTGNRQNPGKLTRINLNAGAYVGFDRSANREVPVKGTAIRNNDGDSLITVNGSAYLYGDLILGGGADVVQIRGGRVEAPIFDFGSGFDGLEITGGTVNIDQVKLTNGPSNIKISGGTVRIGRIITGRFVNSIEVTGGDVRIDSLELVPVRGVGNVVKTFSADVFGRISGSDNDDTIVLGGANVATFSGYITEMMSLSTLGAAFDRSGNSTNWTRALDNNRSVSAVRNSWGDVRYERAKTSIAGKLDADNSGWRVEGGTDLMSYDVIDIDPVIISLNAHYGQMQVKSLLPRGSFSALEYNTDIYHYGVTASRTSFGEEGTYVDVGIGATSITATDLDDKRIQSQARGYSASIEVGKKATHDSAGGRQNALALFREAQLTYTQINSEGFRHGTYNYEIPEANQWMGRLGGGFELSLDASEFYGKVNLMYVFKSDIVGKQGQLGEFVHEPSPARASFTIGSSWFNVDQSMKLFVELDGHSHAGDIERRALNLKLGMKSNW